MKLVILLSVVALAVGDYPPAKPAESYGTPADEPAQGSKTPAFSTSFSSKNHFSSFPSFYQSSYPYSYSSYPTYSSYYNTFKFPSRYQYKLAYKPFSSATFDSSSGFLPIFGGNNESPFKPVLPPNFFPPNVLPPNVFPPSLKPPTELPLPQISGFSSPYFSSYRPFYDNHHIEYPFSYSFPSLTSFQTTFSTKKTGPKFPKQEETYGPPANDSEATPAPAETSDDAPVSYPYEAAPSEGTPSESPDQEYGPPSSKH